MEKNKNSRPLQNLSVEELCKLWELALKVDDKMFSTYNEIVPYGYGNPLLTSTNINHARAGVILHAKLCDKYGIPHPEIKLDLGRREAEYLASSSDTEDEELMYEQEVFEYMNENLHQCMDNFATLSGIGDFEEEMLFFDKEVLKPLLDDSAGTEKEIEEGYLADELTYAGYLKVIDEVKCISYDNVEVVEIAVTKSKKMALFDAAVKNNAVPDGVKEFWESFSVHSYMRTYYWCPMGDMTEIKDDTWCSVYAILNSFEEGILIGNLFKYMSIRIGAYIAQELADRYAVPLAA